MGSTAISAQKRLDPPQYFGYFSVVERGPVIVRADSEDATSAGNADAITSNEVRAAFYEIYSLFPWLRNRLLSEHPSDPAPRRLVGVRFGYRAPRGEQVSLPISHRQFLINAADANLYIEAFGTGKTLPEDVIRQLPVIPD